MEFCNIDINITNKDELFQNLTGKTKCIVTLNAQIIVLANENHRLLEFINKNYVTMDGEVPLKVAKLLNSGFRNITKLSGSDIVYDFCDFAKNNDLKVFFLGGKECSVRKAVENVRKKYGIKVGGFSPRFENYPFSDYFTSECQKCIREFEPDILFVGSGAWCH